MFVQSKNIGRMIQYFRAFFLEQRSIVLFQYIRFYNFITHFRLLFLFVCIRQGSGKTND